MSELLTVDDLRAYLRIGRAKAYELVNEPDFPALRVGRSIRIPKDQLKLWVARNVGGRAREDGQKRRG